MIRSKMLALIVSLVFIVGCASGGIKKPTVLADKPNNIPADITSQFLNRYERFVTDDEQKEFKKLKTDEARQSFIDKFWAERDSDPSTPENEEKRRIDQLIENIADEPFFNASGTTGLLFRSNGGFRGNMAQVYLLHGQPDVMDTIESDNHSFVPLMLWIYGNEQNGEIVYAFMFYQKGGSGAFSLLTQELYQLDQCGAIYEVATLRMYNYVSGGMQSCPEDLYQIYNDIYRSSGRGGNLDGNVFAWALFNFSMELDMKLGEALEPPKPASEIAKQSTARVSGEAPELTGKAGIDYILASCEKCNSMIPAELTLGKSFIISSPLKNFDWTVEGELAKLSLKYRIVLQNNNAGKPIVLEGLAIVELERSWLVENQETMPVIELINPERVATFPPGTYQVSVYVKNILTGKYNTWDKQFTK